MTRYHFLSVKPEDVAKVKAYCEANEITMDSVESAHAVNLKFKLSRQLTKEDLLKLFTRQEYQNYEVASWSVYSKNPF